MPEFSVEAEFDVYCASCGADLGRQTTTSDSRRGRLRCADVEPCQKCLDAAYDEGYRLAEAGTGA